MSEETNYAAAEITFIDRVSGNKTAYTYPITKVILRERDNPSISRVFIANDKGKWEEKK